MTLPQVALCVHGNAFSFIIQEDIKMISCSLNIRAHQGFSQNIILLSKLHCMSLIALIKKSLLSSQLIIVVYPIVLETGVSEQNAS